MLKYSKTHEPVKIGVADVLLRIGISYLYDSNISPFKRNSGASSPSSSPYELYASSAIAASDTFRIPSILPNTASKYNLKSSSRSYENGITNS